MIQLQFVLLVLFSSVLSIKNGTHSQKNKNNSSLLFRNFGGGAENPCSRNLINCQKSKYRTIDGTCNNLKIPWWGAAGTAFGRLVYPKYADGLYEPVKSVTGSDLPSARLVSLELFPDIQTNDSLWSLLTMQWGQIVSHDIINTLEVTEQEKQAAECCKTTLKSHKYVKEKSKICFMIPLQSDDVYFKAYPNACFYVARSKTEDYSQCSHKAPTKYLNQVNLATHWLDASFLYGYDNETHNRFRKYDSGQLQTAIVQDVPLPYQIDDKEKHCVENPIYKTNICYLTGDTKVNWTPLLAILEIIFYREHNRIASKLKTLNPHWNDETLYQEARRIVIAELQHITYYEWLPIVLGSDNLLRNKILYNAKNAYVTDHNAKLDPTISNEFATAAFRVLHNTIQGKLVMLNRKRTVWKILRLSDHFRSPSVINQRWEFNGLVKGMTSQPQKNADRFVTSEVTDFLFRGNNTYGYDLKSFDVQRGRDHGLPSYNTMKEYCGFPKAYTFRDFEKYIQPHLVKKLEKLYKHPDDVELSVGGALEDKLPGTLVGPVFYCIMINQFSRLRVTDQFFYERGEYENRFSAEQLAEIRKVTAARLLCDNTFELTKMQPKAFRLITKWNKLVSCQDYQAIPSLNLNYWKEHKY